jgi:uncharacterized protein (TIGR00369 family)
MFMGNFKKEVTVAVLNDRIQGFLPGLLGVEIVEVAEGRLTGRMKVTPTHLAPNGFFHAGGVVTLADTLCGCGASMHLPDGAAGFTTAELKSNHLGTALEGTLFCVATAQHLGRSTHVWDAVVTEENTGKKIALFRCTQMILWPKK